MSNQRITRLGSAFGAVEQASTVARPRMTGLGSMFQNKTPTVTTTDATVLPVEEAAMAKAHKDRKLLDLKAAIRAHARELDTNPQARLHLVSMMDNEKRRPTGPRPEVVAEFQRAGVWPEDVPPQVA